MSNFRVRKQIRTVPIAVTPEGFWCCPSPAMLQKTLKNPNLPSKNPKKSQRNPSQKTPEHSQNLQNLQMDHTNEPESQTHPPIVAQISQIDPSNNPESQTNTPILQIAPSIEPESQTNTPILPIESSNLPIVPPNQESQPRKISVGFGQPETSNLKVILYNKEGLAVKMSVHSEILSENCNFFGEKLGCDLGVTCIEIFECDDVEIYVETIGLMYCKEVKNRLIKQNVSRVLRILKVSESLGFSSCIKSCLNYLEAVPWEEDEEKNILNSIKSLQICKNTPTNTTNFPPSPYRASPLLKRVVSENTTSSKNETLNEIIDMVLKSCDLRARREMKTLVFNLLKENENSFGLICNNSVFESCMICLNSLLNCFKEASENNFANNPLESREIVYKRITIEADNILWLVEILNERNICEDFIAIWANHAELANLHENLPIISRHVASKVTARLFIGIGKGEMLPNKEVKLGLLNVWLKPLMEDYNWLQQIRSFDRKILEEGIGKTILTLNLEDQKVILINWLGCFLKKGDSCPNLQKAFEVWWRRTFVRPYVGGVE